MSKGTLLVIGAGRGQVPLIEAAHCLGYQAVVVSLPSPHLPGIPIADDLIVADITRPDDVITALGDRQFSGVTTAAIDTGLSALARICAVRAMTGLSEHAAALCRDKWQQKQAFEDASVRTAAFRAVSSEDSLHQAIDSLGLPVVIKPISLQGSRGVTIARSWNEAKAGLERAMTITSDGPVIVEEFIDGIEFGAQAMVRQGEILAFTAHGDRLFSASSPVPIDHFMPSDLPPDLINAAFQETLAAINALGLDNCAVNIDLIARGKDVFVLEATGRAGANGLIDLVSAHLGYDYPEAIVQLALGHDPRSSSNHPSRSHAAVVRMLVKPDLRGVIAAIDVDKAAAPEATYQFFQGVGATVDGFRDSNDCLGQVLVTGDTLTEALLLADTAEQAVTFRLQETRP